MCTLMFTTPDQHSQLHMHGTHNTCRNACVLSAKNAHALVHARLYNGTEASLPWKLLLTYLEFCASIVQAVVCRPPSSLSQRNQSPDAVRSKEPCKSTLTWSPLQPECRISIIRSFVLVQASSSLSMGCSRSVATELTHHRDLFTPFFSRAFQEQGACCLPNFDPRHTAPLWCMQGASTLHTAHRPALS